MSLSIVLLRCLLGLALLCGAPAAAQSADNSDFRQVFLTKDQALRHVFPAALRVLELRHILNVAQIRAIEKLSGRRLDEGGFFLFAAWNSAAGQVDGVPSAPPDAYAVIVAEIGKVRPITHIVEVRPAAEDAAVATTGRVAVMIYRETHGAEVAADRFMAQYRGRTLANAIRVDRDIINIAGSTLSAHAICRGVRKALAVVQVVLLDLPADERVALLARATEATPPPEEDGAATGAAGAVSAGPTEVAAEGALVVEEARVMGTLARITLPIVTGGPSADALHAAAREALAELARWDDILSDWRAETPLSRFNVAPAGQVVALHPGLADYFAHAGAMVAATDGAFDPAVGALVAAWGLRTQSPARPAPEALSAARAQSGWSALQFDMTAATATRLRDGVRLDPGASGKGWALDRAAERLRAAGVTSALLSFRSTLLAIGAPPDAAGWSIPVRHDGGEQDLPVVLLRDAALSVSGGSLAGFEDAGLERGGVLNPRDGVPVPAARLAWVVASLAADADALSTALLVAGEGLPPFTDGQGRSAYGLLLADAAAEPRTWPASAAAARTRDPPAVVAGSPRTVHAADR